MYLYAIERIHRCNFSLKNGYKYQTQGGIMSRYYLLRVL
nr:MAG TPA: hypothetical protein [Caudoviricetes sp.]